MNNIRIINTNNLIYNDDIIYYDIFISKPLENNEKYIVLIYNQGYISPENISDIKIQQFIDNQWVGTPLLFNDFYGDRLNSTELFGIVKYKYLSNKIKVSYKNCVKEFIINNYEDNYNIIASTLLHKPNYNLIPLWVEHYAKLGVEHFYFYINDFNEKNLNELLLIINNCKNITIVNFNFKYWDEKNIPNFGKISFHASQIQSLNHCFYLFKSKHYVFNDLDEFIIVNNSSLKELIDEYKDFSFIALNNKWCKPIVNTPSFEEVLTNKVIMNKTMLQSELPRVKSIVINPDKVKYIFIHGSISKEGYNSIVVPHERAFFRHYASFRKGRGLDNDFFKQIVDPVIENALF